MLEKLTYKKSGVDIEEGNKFVKTILPIAKTTFKREVLMDIGSFGSLFELNISKYKEPILVSGTDGVGTKLKIAFMAGRHNTIGIDLVAMCVNDIITLGADPLFFLDYLAIGKLKTANAKEIIKGIAIGCKEADCSLVGGETAEMPDFYKDDEYDLAGFVVGVVDKKNIIDGSRIKQGNIIIGLASNGIHSNGYSLVRKIFFEKRKMKINQFIPELKTTVAQVLLEPTKIYVKAIKILKNIVNIKGMAHITGGGIIGNVPRIIKDGFTAVIKNNSWEIPSIFCIIQKFGNVPDSDMKKTFNMGIGYVIIIDKKEENIVSDVLQRLFIKSYKIGYIEKGGKEKIDYI